MHTRPPMPITDVIYDHCRGWRWHYHIANAKLSMAAHETATDALRAAISAHYGDGFAYEIRVPYRSRAFEAALQIGWYTFTVDSDDIATMVPPTMMYGNPPKPASLSGALEDITRHQRDFK